MKKIKLINCLIIVGILCISCTKTHVIESDPIPTPQLIKLRILYSGTAYNYFTHYLFFLVNYGSYSPYDNFSFSIINGTINGITMTSPNKFDPGSYEISGFYDFNDSGTWENFEPIIVPKTINVTGIMVEYFDFVLQDKTPPDQDGWIQGSISYLGSSLGSHYVYAEITKESQYQGVFRLINSKVNLSLSNLEYSSGYLSKGIYMLRYFWDLNDDGHFDSNEPNKVKASIYVCPGLPTVINIQLD